MKKSLLIFAAFVTIVGFSNKVMAQITVANSANANIVSPITLEAKVPLEFGDLAVSATVAGSVELSPAAATVPNPLLGVTLMTTGAARTAAKYHVTGVASYVYSISFPSPTATVSNGGNQMTISNFTFHSDNANSATGGTLTSGGADDFYVGAKLTVPAGKATGSYTGNFDVMVNYN